MKPNHKTRLGVEELEPRLVPSATSDAIAALSAGNQVQTLLSNNRAAPVMVSPISLQAGADPYDVATGDWNGDGKRDLAILNSSSNSVTTQRSEGAGVFTNTGNAPTAGDPRSMAVGDFNKDGKDDVVVANFESDSVRILSGTAQGTLTPLGSDITVGSGPRMVRTADLNQDGNLDVVTVNQNGKNFSVLLGDGKGGFGAPKLTSTLTMPASLAIGDWNQDGKLDLAVGSYDGAKIQLLAGDGTGNFTRTADVAVGNQPVSITAADFNGDGKKDLAIANAGSNTLSVLMNIGQGAFGSRTDVPVNSYPEAVVATDVNGDGTVDLVAASFGSSVLNVLVGDGNGGFVAAPSIATGANPMGLTAADVTSDNMVDLITADLGRNGATIRPLYIKQATSPAPSADALALQALAVQSLSSLEQNNQLLLSILSQKESASALFQSAVAQLRTVESGLNDVSRSLRVAEQSETEAQNEYWRVWRAGKIESTYQFDGWQRAKVNADNVRAQYALAAMSYQNQVAVVDAAKAVMIDTLRDYNAALNSLGLVQETISVSDALSFNGVSEIADAWDARFSIALTQLGGIADFKSWQGNTTGATLGALSGDTLGVTSRGGGMTIDLSHAASLVTAVDWTIQADGGAQTIDIQVFRGNQLIASQTAFTGESVHFSDAQGITGIVLRNPNATTGLPANLRVSSFSASGDSSQLQPSVQELTPKGNASVGQMASKQWTSGMAYNVIDVAKNSNVRFRNMSGPNTFNGQILYDAQTIRTDVYARHEARILDGGSVRITGVYYINENGVHVMPPQFYTLASSNVVITHPGAPDHLILQLSGNGQFDVGTNMQTASTYDAIAPKPGIQIQPDILGLRAQLSTQQGFLDGVTEITSRNAVLNPGGSVNVLAQLTNNGTQGGDVVVRVYAGYTGTASDPLQGEFRANFAVGQVRALSANVSVPSSSSTAQTQPFITIIATLPDGTQTTYQKRPSTAKSADDYQKVLTASSSPVDPNDRSYATLQRRIDAAVAGFIGGKINLVRAGQSSPSSASTATQDIFWQNYEQIQAQTSGINTALLASAVGAPSTNIEGILIKDIDDHQDLGQLIKTPAPWQIETKSPLYKVNFEIMEKSMVNIWLDQNRNADMRLVRADGKVIDISNKAGGSAESISCALDPAKYTLEVTRNGSYTEFTGSQMKTVADKTNTYINITSKKYDARKVEGMVSIDGRLQSLPASLSVAEFELANAGGKRKELKDVNILDTTRAVWVVIHGRSDNENSDNMKYLEQQLFYKGYQVVTLNWSESAKDNSYNPLSDRNPLSGADWITTVGLWAANQLKAMGFAGNKINIPSHSWGSFVAYEIAKNYKNGTGGNGYGVQSIVALDTPKDPLPNTYPATDVVFSDVTNASWAFRSSFFGSTQRSNSAAINFDLPAPSEADEKKLVEAGILSQASKTLLDAGEALLAEHGYAVSFFANLIRGMGDSSVSVLNADDLMNGKIPSMKIDPYGVEGTLPISLQEINGLWQAVPTKLIPII